MESCQGGDCSRLLVDGVEMRGGAGASCICTDLSSYCKSDEGEDCSRMVVGVSPL
jgi:hypothetical protein